MTSIRMTYTGVQRTKQEFFQSALRMRTIFAILIIISLVDLFVEMFCSHNFIRALYLLSYIQGYVQATK